MVSVPFHPSLRSRFTPHERFTNWILVDPRGLNPFARYWLAKSWSVTKGLLESQTCNLPQLAASGTLTPSDRSARIGDSCPPMCLAPLHSLDRIYMAYFTSLDSPGAGDGLRPGILTTNKRAPRRRSAARAVRSAAPGRHLRAVGILGAPARQGILGAEDVGCLSRGFRCSSSCCYRAARPSPHTTSRRVPPKLLGFPFFTTRLSGSGNYPSILLTAWPWEIMSERSQLGR